MFPKTPNQLPSGLSREIADGFVAQAERIRPLDPRNRDFLVDREHNRDVLSSFSEAIDGRDGIRSYGNGTFAIVLGREDEGHVVKLFSNDVGYDAFLDLVETRSEDPHLPRLVGEKTALGGGASAIAMERLYAIDLDDEGDDRIHVLLALVVYGADPSMTPGGLADVMTSRCHDVSPERRRQAGLVMDFLRNQPGILSTLDAVKSAGVGLDVKHDSIMTRADGTFVITDPFFEGANA